MVGLVHRISEEKPIMNTLNLLTGSLKKPR